MRSREAGDGQLLGTAPFGGSEERDAEGDDAGQQVAERHERRDDTERVGCRDAGRQHHAEHRSRDQVGPDQFGAAFRVRQVLLALGLVDVIGHVTTSANPWCRRSASMS